MIFDREHKVAVASDDGVCIASHLGSASLFVVYAVKRGRLLGEETRENHIRHSSRLDDSQAGCWEIVEELLPDVRVVISRGMGENAYVGLLRRDVLPITTDEEEVASAIQAYLRGNLVDNPQLIHRSVRDSGHDYKIDIRKIQIMKGDTEDSDIL
jgi:predicted Fe-Mo cluster-binding NifX family protein